MFNCLVALQKLITRSLMLPQAFGLGFAIALAAAILTQVGTLEADSITTPPASRKFSSPDGQYIFMVSAVDPWRSTKVTGKLFRVSEDAHELLWSKALPEEYGPRFATVSSSGQVLLVDEWIHVKSPYALMLFDPAGRLIAQHEFTDIQETLGQPVSDVVDLAKWGWWVSAEPVLDSKREVVTIKAGGRILGVRLSDGRLYLEEEG